MLRRGFLRSIRDGRALLLHRQVLRPKDPSFIKGTCRSKLKPGYFFFFCFGYSQQPVIVLILNYTGLWPTKHSFKISNRQREPKRCKKLLLPATHFAASTQASWVKVLSGHPRKTAQAEYTYANAQGKNILGAGSWWKGSDLKKLHLKAQGCLVKVEEHSLLVEKAASSTMVPVSASLPWLGTISINRPYFSSGAL